MLDHRVLQLVDVEPGRIQPQVRQPGDLGQQPALRGDAFLDRAARGERMDAPRLAIAVDQHVVGAVEEQHIDIHAAAAQVRDDAGHR